MIDLRKPIKEVSSTEYFELGNGQVQKVELHSSFQPEKGLTREKHLDTMYHDYHKQPVNTYPIHEIAHLTVTGTQQLDKAWSN